MAEPVRFLFVDDEQPILSVLARALKNEGFELHFTADARLALDIVRERDIEAVVCDHLMPGMKGTDLLALVRDTHVHVVRVLVSGSPERPVVDARTIDKPWHLTQLKALLHEVEAEVLARRADRR